MTAVSGPPGTGKTTNISGLLRLLLQHHRLASSRKPLRIFLCAPTNHAVQELEFIVSQLKSEHDFAFIRICSARMMKGSGKGKRFGTGRRKGGGKSKDKGAGKGKVLHTFDSSVVDRLAQRVDVNSLGEVLANSSAEVTIVLSTLGVLQKSPSATYDPLKTLRTSCNWVLIDEAGQTVDTDAYILHPLLSRDGRYVLFGDPKQLSCFQLCDFHGDLQWMLPCIGTARCV